MPMRLPPPSDPHAQEHDDPPRASPPQSPLGFVLYVACVLAVLGVCITWMEASAGLLA